MDEKEKEMLEKILFYQETYIPVFLSVLSFTLAHVAEMSCKFDIDFEDVKEDANDLMNKLIGENKKNKKGEK